MTGLAHSDRRPILSRPLFVGGLLLCLLSTILSVFAYSVLPEAVRIHWQFGGPYYHYGPEFAPLLVVVVGFPLLLGALYVGSRWLGTYIEDAAEFDDLRLLYEWSALLAMGTVLLVQSAIIALNLLV